MHFVCPRRVPDCHICSYLQVVEASVDLFFNVLRDLKPIPAKSHYTFNLRDVSKIVQGVLMMRPTQIPSKEALAKLWAHEAMRVFCDRLIDTIDRAYFTNMVRALRTTYQIGNALTLALPPSPRATQRASCLALTLSRLARRNRRSPALHAGAALAHRRLCIPAFGPGHCPAPCWPTLSHASRTHTIPGCRSAQSCI